MYHIYTNDNTAGDEFGYLSWLCYLNGFGESVERYDSKVPGQYGKALKAELDKAVIRR
jgi:hypothetical protein